MSISIVICSRTKDLSTTFKKNIKETVGVDHEVIIIDNSKNKYSIFEAYNIGVERSKFPILAFIHDDVIFHTSNWGAKLTTLFNENSEIGLLGVAGSRIKTKIPSAWWDNLQKELVIHLIQHYPSREKKMLEMGFDGSDLKEVSIIDGVFMVMRKQVNLRFNENLSGFHNYDQSISIDTIKAGYKVFVTREILLEHFSLGKKDRNWFNSTLDFHKLYKDKLPLTVNSEKITPQHKNFTANVFFKSCRSYGTKLMVLKYWLSFKIKSI